MNKVILIAVLFLGTLSSHAQQKKWNFSAGLGYNFMSYMGDLNGKLNINKIPNPRTGYSLYFEKRFGHWASVDIKMLMGTVSQRENTISSSYNFESSITCFDVDAYFHFDNDIIMPSTSIFAPYLGVGIGYFMFDPKADLRDKNGNLYNEWADGSIRNLPETPENVETARIVSKDYTFETKLTDPNVNYSRSSYTVPLTFGVKFKFLDNLETRIAATVYLTGTDYLDNIALVSGNDMFYATAITVNYHFGHGGDPDEVMYEDVNFSGLMHEDADGDGIQDIKDMCQSTPKGVKVDKNGCPLDDDKDGVPNYLDKEPGSAPGSVVDAQGRTLTDEMLEKLALMRDSVMTTRTTTFYEAPSMDALAAIDTQILEKREKAELNHPALPEKFKGIDTDGNGIISSKEVTSAIDMFLDGSLDVSVETLHDMIDYFFEQ